MTAKECRVAQMGADAKPHSEGCRELIRQAIMNDDVGQQRLLAAKSARLVGRRTTVCGNERVEAAQEGPDDAMNRSACCEQRERSGREESCCDVIASRKRGSEEEVGPPDDPRISRRLMSHRWASAKWQ